MKLDHCLNLSKRQALCIQRMQIDSIGFVFSDWKSILELNCAQQKKMPNQEKLLEYGDLKKIY